MRSEVARLLEQITAEEESGQLGLYGLAAQASHDAIIARMRPGEETLVQLFRQGRDQEAYDLWDGGILEGKTQL